MKKRNYLIGFILVLLVSCICKEPTEPVVVEDDQIVGTWYIHDYTISNVSVFAIQQCDVGSWIELKADNSMQALIKCDTPPELEGTWSREGDVINIDADKLFNVNKALLSRIDNQGTVLLLTDEELQFEFAAYTTLNIKLMVKVFLSRTPLETVE